MRFEDHSLALPRRWIDASLSSADGLGKTWRTCLPPVTLIVFLAGYVAGCNDWVHFGWLLAMAVPAAMTLQGSAIGVQMSRSGFMAARTTSRGRWCLPRKIPARLRHR